MTRPARTTKANPVRQRRMYVDWSHGQLHLRTAFPPSGGFDELTPLVCLHGERETSRVFSGLLAQLGGERSVYAPDLPGFGESDAPPQRAGAAAYAAAVADFLEQMRLRTVDVLGHLWGGWVAAELALSRPDLVRRVVLVSAPVAGASPKVPQCIGRLAQPVLVLRPRDGQHEITSDVRAILPAAKLLDLPNLGDRSLESSPEEVARRIRSFLG